MFNPYFGMQTDLGYFETSGDDNLKVSAIPLAVSLKLAVPIAFVEPYALGGAGVYFCQGEGRRVATTAARISGLTRPAASTSSSGSSRSARRRGTSG